MELLARDVKKLLIAGSALMVRHNAIVDLRNKTQEDYLRDVRTHSNIMAYEAATKHLMDTLFLTEQTLREQVLAISSVLRWQYQSYKVATPAYEDDKYSTTEFILTERGESTSLDFLERVLTEEQYTAKCLEDADVAAS